MAISISLLMHTCDKKCRVKPDWAYSFFCVFLRESFEISSDKASSRSGMSGYRSVLWPVAFKCRLARLAFVFLKEVFLVQSLVLLTINPLSL